ncbi:ROK family protein [Thermogemmatispora sp.]|uniref:ROK family protein n=1 Tax=Thermogemmatispora sp. TaxID=1968838 RepID=UPI0035E41122
MYLGIDVGEHLLRGAFFQQKEVVLTEPLAVPDTYEGLLEALAQLVQEVARAGEAIRRLGVSIPGNCTERRAVWVPSLPYLNGRDLADDLRARLGVSVMLASDAQLALLGEVWRGVARDRQSAALVSVGTGVSGALMLGGRIIHGAHGSAGALGWLVLDRQQAPNPDRGYLDLYASASALASQGRLLDPPLSPEEIIGRAREGQASCVKLVNDCALVLGMAVAGLASVFDPEVVIFGGALTGAFDLFAPLLREGLLRYGSPSVRQTPLLASQLGADASAYGALRAAMVLQSMWA